jgi:DMSO/TMAO reductase YedYZ molybdopterin-dependent catalytic subunit
MALALHHLARSEINEGQMPAGKDKRLRIISDDPLALETPDELLAAGGMTPATALFVRNHHGAKAFCDMKARPAVGNLEIGGLVGRRQSVPLANLADLESTEVEMVLQCSGNFRSQFSRISPIKGTPWNKGAIGNVRFRGVPIVSVFKAIKLEIAPTARYLTASGSDLPEKRGQVQYEKSVPLDVALTRGLLATELNGEPLPAVHGGPLRLVIPGYYGTVQVKWLTSLRLDATESANYYQMTDY